MGEWITVRRHWYDIGVRNCSVCGKMLPGEIWSVDIAGRPHAFCDPECEDLYWQYWRPRYGAFKAAGGASPQHQVPTEAGEASPGIEGKAAEICERE